MSEANEKLSALIDAMAETLTKTAAAATSAAATDAAAKSLGDMRRALLKEGFNGEEAFSIIFTMLPKPQ